MTEYERRDVAASLRASANVGGARTLKRELAKALGIQLDRYTPEGSHTKILRGLADLIEPVPERTCRMIDNGAEFCCSECDWRHNYDDEPLFCAGCGAKVVQYGD